MAFPFELLDIYLGAWAACFLPVPEADLRPAAADECPENCGHLQVLLRHFHNDAEALLAAVTPDLRLRGLSSCGAAPTGGACVRRSGATAGSRIWSAEQEGALAAVAAGVAAADAEEGTGKTEVAIEAAIRAAQDGCRVLLAGPIGLLVNAHRGKIPPRPRHRRGDRTLFY